MTAQPEVRAGQIWREVNKRFVRFARIVRVDAGKFDPSKSWALIETVGKEGGAWLRVRRTRQNHAAIARFNGKSGGYEIVDLQDGAGG